LSCSGVRSAISTGTSFNPASLQALNRILPPKIIISLLSTIGRNSSICGNSLMELTSFSNLSSFINLGLLGLGLISFIGRYFIYFFFLLFFLGLSSSGVISSAYLGTKSLALSFDTSIVSLGLNFFFSSLPITVV